MKAPKKPESIQAARQRLTLEIVQSQSSEAMIKHTVELLKLVASYPPDNPVFYQKLNEMQQKIQKPARDKHFLDLIQDN